MIGRERAFCDEREHTDDNDDGTTIIAGRRNFCGLIDDPVQ